MSAERIEPPEQPAAWSNPARIGFESLIGQGPVMLAVSTVVQDVAPDAQRAAGPVVVLRFGRNLKPEISDLAWDDSGLIGTLAFGPLMFTCRIPWFAVLAMKSETGLVAPVLPKRRPTHLKLI